MNTALQANEHEDEKHSMHQGEEILWLPTNLMADFMKSLTTNQLTNLMTRSMKSLPTNQPTNLMAGSVKSIIAKVEKDCCQQPGQWRVPSKIHLWWSWSSSSSWLSSNRLISVSCLLNWDMSPRLTWYSNHLVVFVDGVIDVDHHELAGQARQGHQHAKGDAVGKFDQIKRILSQCSVQLSYLVKLSARFCSFFLRLWSASALRTICTTSFILRRSRSPPVEVVDEGLNEHESDHPRGCSAYKVRHLGHLPYGDSLLFYSVSGFFKMFQIICLFGQSKKCFCTHLQ